MITHTHKHIFFFFREMSNEYSDNFSINYQVTLKWLHTLVLSLIYFSIRVTSWNFFFCFLITIYNLHI